MILDFLQSEAFLQTVGELAAVVIFGLIAKFAKDAAQKKKLEGLVEAGIPIAFKVVEEAKRHYTGDKKLLNKTETGLAALEQFVKSHGAELKESHRSRAALVFQAMHFDATKKEAK